MTHHDNLTLDQLIESQKHLAAIDAAFEKLNNVWQLSPAMTSADNAVSSRLSDVEQFIANIKKRDAKNAK